MNFQQEYQAKLCTSAEAIATIPDHVTLSMGMGVSEPPALLGALAQRVERGELEDIKLYYFESKEYARNTILRYELMGKVKPYCMFLSAIERELILKSEEEGRKLVYFVPNHFSQSARILAEIEIEAFIVTVSSMDKNGFFTFGTNNDYGTTVARSAKRLIVEVNPRMPRVFGDSLLHISEVDCIVEHDTPLPQVLPIPPTPEDKIIGQQIAELIPNGATLQMGIGSLPNAVCHFLRGHKGLGIHTELFTPGLMELIECGAVDNSCKNINRMKSVFTFAMGDQSLYDFIHDNPAVESYPVNYVNDPAVIAKNDQVVSINSTLEMDLTGACNSEYIHGHQYSSTGGQVDFVRGAYASRGGKSIIAFHSTAAREELSRIVPQLQGPVTTPRTDVHLVMTEFGFADLKGKSSTERACALIQIAHPNFREALTEAARKMHLI